MLEVQGLTLQITVDGEPVRAVSNLSLNIQPGRVLALVGESGCGKSLTAQALLRLGEFQGVKKTSGKILLEGIDLDAMDRESLRKVRGGKISMIFQEPMTALNPVFSVGSQIVEVIRLHLDMNKQQALARAKQLLHDVGLQQVEQLLKQYPDSLSGGMRQRILIAMAMAGDPDYIIADEPTTALDVSVQKRMIHLLRNLQRKRNLGMLLVTHDFGLVAEMADDVAVMYAGEVIEYGAVADIFEAPSHPYTQALMQCRPEANREKHATLKVISGQVPAPGRWPSGCRFAPRCTKKIASCTQNDIALNCWQSPSGDSSISPSPHMARCLRVAELQ
ncbi:MAG: ABC transporter ATP-binding protein [Zetaproteobacteria bacterium]|nr:ABC transporter ATP-binding protein [Zetaproteobacteria bacterium]